MDRHSFNDGDGVRGVYGQHPKSATFSGMDETFQFLVLSGASALVVSSWIVKNRINAASRAGAEAFYWISIALSSSALLWISLDALGLLPTNTTSSWWFRLLIYRLWLVIGTAVSCATLLILNNSLTPRLAVASNATHTFLTSPYVLKGISVSVSISFFCTEIGKLTHDAEMRQFFLQSGYPLWFVYFTIAAETMGAVGLLLPRTATPAALSLLAIMVGAIGTHVHNRDPFSDSLEALHLLALLVCILVIRLLHQHRDEMASPPS